MKDGRYFTFGSSFRPVVARNLESTTFEGNPLRQWTSQVSVISVTVNILVFSISKILPLGLKNALMSLRGIEIGEDVAIALGVQMDVFYPEKIHVGDGSVIGYGTTILTHETTTQRFSVGEVKIGEDVLVGANTTVLPGVEIGDGATVSANSLVNRDVEPGEKVGGVPVKNIGGQ